MAITDLGVRDNLLQVTIGMEKWSATLSFSLEDIEGDTTSTIGQGQGIKDYSAKIDLLGSSEKLSEELRTVGHGHDVEYVKALLKAGADPLEKYEAS